MVSFSGFPFDLLFFDCFQICPGVQYKQGVSFFPRWPPALHTSTNTPLLLTGWSSVAWIDQVSLFIARLQIFIFHCCNKAACID